MENRKRRLIDIGRTPRAKVHKQELNSGLKSRQTIEDENVYEETSFYAINQYQTSYGEKPEVFTKAVIKVSDSEQLNSSRLSVNGNRDIGGNFEKQQCQNDHTKHKNRVYVRDDSGYQSEDCFDCSSSSETDDYPKSQNADRVNTQLQTTVNVKTKARSTEVTQYESHLDINVNPANVSTSFSRRSCCNEPIVQKLQRVDEATQEHEGDYDVDDDESDVIVPCGGSESILKAQPISVDKRWASHSLRSHVEERLFKYGTLQKRNSLSDRMFGRYINPDEKWTIYIPHKYADTPIGDEFGVQIWTYRIKEDHGVIYYQHFFFKVAHDGPAYKMKIRDNDEIVLVNGKFVPQLKHDDLVDIFKNVKVDGSTRFKLIIRRVEKVNPLAKKEWEWIETSAVLAPDMRQKQDHYPKVEETEYKSKIGDGIEVAPCIKQYRIPGTPYFLDIRNGKVFVDVKSDTEADKSKRICKRACYKINPDNPDGLVEYFAALSNEERTSYVSIAYENEVKLDCKPMWFKFKSDGAQIWFKGNELFLSCNRTTCQLKTDHKQFLFDECSPDNGLDYIDAQAMDTTSYSNDQSCSTITAAHWSKSVSTSADVCNGESVEITSGDLSPCANGEYNSFQSAKNTLYTSVNCPHKDEEKQDTGITLNIPSSSYTSRQRSSSPCDILKTPTTPFASLFLAN